MKKTRSRITFFSLPIILFLALNWAGDQLVSRLNWPFWLDSVGTVLCAWLYGPVCGAITGATSNLLAHIIYGTSWYYALISILVALIVGFAARRGKLNTMLDTLTTSAVLAGSVSVAAYPINLILSGGSTGNNWGDAVIGFLSEQGLPHWIGLVLGDLYVELLDKLVILVALFVITRFITFVLKLRKNRKQPEKEEEPASTTARTAALLLAVGIGLSAMGAAPAKAAGNETYDASETDYNDYVQTIYSASNGLPCGEANDIAMTGDGIMWVGTYAGLYRYNGREFRWMDSLDSVRNVNALYVDEEGRLWIGTNDNGLSIMINERIVNVIDQSQGLPSNAVKSIIKSSDGYYYIGTTGSMQVLTLNCGLMREGIISEAGYTDHLAADSSGNVAAVNNDGTLFLMRQGKIISSRKLQGGSEVFRSCAFDPEGDLLAATTTNHIHRFRISQGYFEPLGVMECPGLQNIKNMHYLESGEFFICADNGIAYLNRAGEYEWINTNDFNNSIDNMLVDYQGNLWFTSSRLGLLRMTPSDFRDLYSTAGMDNRVVNTIVQWNGVYYFGTDKGMDAVNLQGKKQVTDKITERFPASGSAA